MAKKPKTRTIRVTVTIDDRKAEAAARLLCASFAQLREDYGAACEMRIAPAVEVPAA